MSPDGGINGKASLSEGAGILPRALNNRCREILTDSRGYGSRRQER